MAEADFHPERKWTLAFTRRGGRSPERAQRGREAPAAPGACPRHPAEIENALRGCFGGDARGPECWYSQHDRKSGAGRGFAAPSATDIHAFPPGGDAADGGPNPQSGVWHQIDGRSPITGPALLRAAQASQTSPDGENSCPQGSKTRCFTSAGRRNAALEWATIV